MKHVACSFRKPESSQKKDDLDFPVIDIIIGTDNDKENRLAQKQWDEHWSKGLHYHKMYLCIYFSSPQKNSKPSNEDPPDQLEDQADGEYHTTYSLKYTLIASL